MCLQFACVNVYVGRCARCVSDVFACVVCVCVCVCVRVCVCVCASIDLALPGVAPAPRLSTARRVQSLGRRVAAARAALRDAERPVTNGVANDNAFVEMRCCFTSMSAGPRARCRAKRSCIAPVLKPHTHTHNTHTHTHTHTHTCSNHSTVCRIASLTSVGCQCSCGGGAVGRANACGGTPTSRTARDTSSGPTFGVTDGSQRWRCACSSTATSGTRPAAPSAAAIIDSSSSSVNAVVCARRSAWRRATRDVDRLTQAALYARPTATARRATTASTSEVTSRLNTHEMRRTRSSADSATARCAPTASLTSS